MTIAFFPAGLIFSIPKGLFLLGLIGVLVAGIAEFRKGHIGRPAIFINSLLLWQIFFSVWTILPVWMQWYLNIGSIVGLIALVAYIPKWSLPTEFYQFCYYAYGSLSIILVIFMSFYLKITLW